MGLNNKGQNDDGVTRTPGTIGIQEAQPPKDVGEGGGVQRGPAGMAPDVAAPLEEVDLRKKKTHVQIEATEPAPEKKDPAPAKKPKVAKKVKTSWIEFHVVRKKSDDTEENVSGVNLHVVLPDSNEEDLKTGGNGKKKKEAIDPGTCDIKKMRYRRMLEVVSIKAS